MRFSNERYYDLSDNELARQHELFAPLRQRHAAELFAAGTTERVIGSTAISNQFVFPGQGLTEGTEIAPIREDVEYTVGHVLVERLTDTGLLGRDDTGIQTIITGVGQVLSALQGPTYLFNLGRLEPNENGYETNRYFAGLKLTEESRVALDVESVYRPVAGVTVADVALIDRQLHEVRDFAEEHKLVIIDPVTLTIGNGVVIG